MAAPIKEVAAGFIIWRKRTADAAIQYLLLQHSYGKQHWTPPKGHVDPGESEMQAAIRETEEEAGLRHGTDYTPTDPDRFKIELQYHSSVSGEMKRVVYWLGELNLRSGEADPGSNPASDSACEDPQVKLSHEHRDFRWACLTEALGFLEYENTRDMLSKADEYLVSRKS